MLFVFITRILLQTMAAKTINRCCRTSKIWVSSARMPMWSTTTTILQLAAAAVTTWAPASTRSQCPCRRCRRSRTYHLPLQPRRHSRRTRITRSYQNPNSGWAKWLSSRWAARMRRPNSRPLPRPAAAHRQPPRKRQAWRCTRERTRWVRRKPCLVARPQPHLPKNRPTPSS